MGGGLDGDGNYAGRLDIFNNVVYNWYSRVTDGGAHEVNFVGNFYKMGAATKLKDITLSADLEGTGGGSQSYYYHNNVLQNTNGSFTCDGSNDECGRRYTLSNNQVLDWEVFRSKPFFASYATVQSAKAAYKDVLSDVGQSMPLLDDHDTRIIQEVKNGTYTYTGSVGNLPGIPDRESDVGGMENYPSTSWADDYDSDMDGLPDFWEKMFGYNPKSAKGDFSDANNDRLGDGWTELERFLEWMAKAHVVLEKGETKTIDLSQWTKGYDGGSYKVTAPNGVTASVSGSKLTVELSENFAGVGYVTFTLTDKEGDTFTRKIGVSQGLAVSSGSSSSSVAGSSSSSEASSGNVYQAEDGNLINASFEDKNAGFHGTGYVNYAGENESSVEISVHVDSPGEYLVELAYANGKAETRKLSVSASGNTPQILEFETTGAWTNWETKSLVLALSAGETIIQISTVDGDGPNLDQITLKKQETSAVFPILAKAFRKRVGNRIVYLEGIPENVKITIVDLNGQRKTIPRLIQSGNNAVLYLESLQTGVYLVDIRGVGKNRGFHQSFKVMR